jgi:outer membrane lipoprotein-sorting protein
MLFKRLAMLLVVVLVFGGGSLGFAAFNAAPAPQDILNHAVATLQAAQDGHAMLTIEGDSPDKSGSATIEAWAKKLSGGDNPTYGFRAEVRQTSEAQAQGAIAVSDGQQFWAYAPSQNTVWTGSVAQMYNNNSSLPFSSLQGLVQYILDISTVTLSGTEPVQGHSAYKLQFVPRPDKVPPAVASATGLLWIDTARWLPLQASINAGSIGQGRVTATVLELNIGVSDDLFHFQVPQGATVVPVQNQQPQHLSLSEADTAAGFKVLKPAYVPDSATLVDVLKMGHIIVLRYEAAPGSFTIAEDVAEQSNTARGSGQSVSVRGTTGTLLTNKTGNQVLLVWTENGRTFSVSGALSSQDALRVAEALQ